MEKKTADVKYFMQTGPPSSPPMNFDRLSTKTMITRTASVQKIVTEKARLKQKRNMCNSLSDKIYYVTRVVIGL